MKVLRVLKSPYMSLALNTIYGLGNCAVGFLTQSWWFVTMGAYYAVLAVTRSCVLLIHKKAATDPETAGFAGRVTGVLLVALSLCIVGVNVLSAVEARGADFHEIIMIAIATYTFTKITLAIISLVKARNAPLPTIKALRNISLAEACVSVYSMQRSMLVSFPGMNGTEILILNIFTGTAVWIVVLLLGLNLMGGKHIDMAKSKIVVANEKIAKAVTSGYKKIEKGVVDSYTVIEKSVVRGYSKIEDAFVEQYLTKEGETVEEAKKRIKGK